MATAQKREGSPFWCYDFQVGGQQFRGATSFALTEPKRKANVWIEGLKVQKRKELEDQAKRQASEDDPLAITIDQAFARYYTEIGQRRADAKDIWADLCRIQDYFKHIIE